MNETSYAILRCSFPINSKCKVKSRKWMSLFLESNPNWDFNLQKLRQTRNKNKPKGMKKIDRWDLICGEWLRYTKAFENSYEYPILSVSF